ncbi:MAG: hypothetical protein RLY87_2249 [Chloroflexota bacterium]|jgi:AraC-like DNA-binding protein
MSNNSTSQIDLVAGDTNARFRAAMARVMTSDGTKELIPGVLAIRRSQPYSTTVHGLHRPALCIVAQGCKAVYVRDETYTYHPQQMLVFALDMPIAAQILDATPDAPFFALRLDFAAAQIATVVREVFPNGIPPEEMSSGIAVIPSDIALIDTLLRLVQATVHPEDARIYGPLFLTEALIRLLRSSAGPLIAQIGVSESRMARIGKAIAHIQMHYTQALDMQEVADLVALSPSSFHQQFKTATRLSPLQYQKMLRLQEARRLLLSTDMDTQQVAAAVGYQSGSQFTREYHRYFGAPPTRDIARFT